MSFKIFSLLFIWFISFTLSAQVNDSINKSDINGKKQGHWIKKYPNGNILYDGHFKDDQPTGEFKRYFDNKHISSVLNFSSNHKEVQASLFHPNGFLASKGEYLNQAKEGDWEFFSSNIEGYLICEEEYSGNIRNGRSIKYYPDGSVAERLFFVNDMKNGEWVPVSP